MEKQISSSPGQTDFFFLPTWVKAPDFLWVVCSEMYFTNLTEAFPWHKAGKLKEHEYTWKWMQTGQGLKQGTREVADRSVLKTALFTNSGHQPEETLINKTTQSQVPKNPWELLLLTNVDSIILKEAKEADVAPRPFQLQTFPHPHSPIYITIRGEFSLGQTRWLSVPFYSAMQRMLSSISELLFLHRPRQFKWRPSDCVLGCCGFMVNGILICRTNN